MKAQPTVAGYIFDRNKLLLVYHKKLGLWLPVGGHIDKNELPDDALKREIFEETNLKIEILGQRDFPIEGNVERNLAVPFYANVHLVGDHYHSCFYYAARALNPKELSINEELEGHGWFSKKGLNKDFVPADVRNQGLEAFKILRRENATNRKIQA